MGLPVQDGHVLVSDATDSTKGEAFHRAIGGGIEFGETAEAAVRREFKEELGISLTAVRILGVLENIFDYEGKRGHEIVHVFSVHSEEFGTLPLETRLRVLDEGSPVGWRRVSELDRPLYPTGAVELLRALVRADA